MDYVMRQLILLLTKISEAFEKHNVTTNQIRKNSEQQSEIQHEAVKKILAAHNKTECDRAKSESRQYSVQNSTRWAAWFTTCATIGAVFAATWYACITHGMWQEMQNQTKEFQLADKPWVAAYRWTLCKSHERPCVRQDSSPDITSDTMISIQVQNFGKTPALNVHAAGKTYVLPDGSNVDSDTGKLSNIRAVLPPGETWLPFYVDVTNSSKELAEYNQGRKNLYVQARIEYCDTAGNLDWINFCIYHVHSNTNPDHFEACGPGDAGGDSTSTKCNKPR